MSVLPTQVPHAPRATFTAEPLYPLTVDQYHVLIQSGKLGEDDPVELIDGLLVFKMPKSTPHTTACALVRRAVESLLPPGWHYRSQEPVTLSDGEPEPDGAVVRGGIEDYARHHPGPGDVAVVIEVAETSLDRDRGLKLHSYARNGITEYWIVNLGGRRVEVFLPGGAALEYAAPAIYAEGESIPVRLAGSVVGTIRVGSILPPR